MDEFSLIATHFAPLAQGADSALGLQDDAALLSVPAGQQVVMTQDSIAQGVHFLGTETPGEIAQKLLRVNLSDMAAMGATPLYYLFSAGWPKGVDEAYIAQFAQGLAADQAEFRITLMGGDTIALAAQAVHCVTMLGLVPQGQALRRNGAQAGDAVYVSGTIGDGALGLLLERDKTIEIPDAARRALCARYRLPRPRIALGMALRGLATACLDVSDGLLQDAGHIARASSVQIVLNRDSIPLSEHAEILLKKMPSWREKIVSGGDDYELLFTAPADSPQKMAKIAAQTGVSITHIGHVSQGSGVELLDANGQPVAICATGYRHAI